MIQLPRLLRSRTATIVECFGNGFALFLAAVGSSGGSLASSVVIAKLVKAVTIPDPIVETAIGTAAFFGGAVAIILLVAFLIASTMPRIT